MTKPIPHIMQEYSFFFELSTRWMDNDIYGHINNVVYYSYFDTIVNSYLIDHTEFDIHHDQIIGLIVHSECNYHASITFPDKITGAFRVNRLGNTSVEYGVAIFSEHHDKACAQGTLTHVFVDRQTQQPQSIAGRLRAALSTAIV